MGKSAKKEIRRKFRDACFKRDGYRCVVCGFQSSPEKALDELDAHHINPREEMPNGGYVKENGVTLCDPAKSGGAAEEGCHYKAEMVLLEPTQLYPASHSSYRFAPEQLYVAIGSSWKKAVEAALKL